MPDYTHRLTAAAYTPSLTPALHNMLPELLRGLGLALPGRLTQCAQQWARVAESRLIYVPPAQTVKEAARAMLVLAGIGAVGPAAFRSLRRNARS